VIKTGAADPALTRHRGPALVFNSAQEADARLSDPGLDVTPDHVLVLRNIGPVGAGMPEAGSIPIPLRLARAGVRDMVRVSDGRMSGTSYGTVVLHCSPEAAVGGPLSLVRDGDVIELDAAAGRIDLLVDPGELARREPASVASPLGTTRWRRLYVEHVTQADRGADFDF
jgi:dihydroxy-acid dehydratase